MPLKPREMSGAGVPAIGVPSWLMLTVPALASAVACVIAVHVCPGATLGGSTARCAETGATATATTNTSSAFHDRVTGCPLGCWGACAGVGRLSTRSAFGPRSPTRDAVVLHANRYSWGEHHRTSSTANLEEVGPVDV